MLREVGMATEAAATVLLELTISSESVEGERKQPAVDAVTLDDHGWASLIQQCSQEDLQFLSFLIPRDLLQQKSTFFQSLLGGNFRESSENHVRVSWDTATFCSLLQCMCSGKLHISASNMERLLEGILFFGVESAMAALIEAIRRGNVLKWVPKLWSLAKGMGQQSVADVCVETIAINFEDVIKQSNFQDLPSVLLAACIDHKQLTVSSEKSLCEAVLNWFLCHQNLHKNTMEEVSSSEVHSSELVPVAFEGDHKQLHNKHFSSLDSTILGISQKIRVMLLPLEFILGCLFQNCAASMFLVEASEVSGYDKLLLLIEEAGKKEFAHLIAAESDELTLRITNHSVRIDLAGCQQITMAMLFQAVLRFVRQSGVNDLQSYLEVEIEVRKLSCNKGFRSSLKSFDQDWCRALSLKNLCHVNLERCWRVDQESLVIWLCLVCPNLKLLNISHCPQLQANILPLISLSCKSLETVNLSLYFKRNPVKPYIGQDEVHVENHTHSRYPENYWRHGSLTCLTSLSLQGRSSLMDWNLELVARCCPNLSDVNLGGCCQLTDQGLSVFLANFSNLTVFQAAYTAFGSLSASALLQKQMVSTACPPSRVLHSSHPSDDTSNPILNFCPLTTLDLEGCLGVDQVSVAKLLNKALFLINLNLGFTVVDDRTILSFEGTSLQKLDLRETQVSEHGLAHIVKWNSNLKVLNIRGCRRAVVPVILADADFSQVVDRPLKESMPKGLALDDLAVGWGFFDSTLKAWKSALYSLQSLSLGVGGRISETALGSLYEVTPLLEYLALNFQVISDESLLNLLRNLPKLRRIELHHCLGEIPSKFVDVISTNLTCLSLERGVAWMTDADVYLLGGSCKGLTQLSLVGCQFLTSKSLCAMAQMWRGMIKLQLEECGTMTSEGGSCLFVCKALQQLTLRHNGLGLHRNFARRAIFELPLLQDLCLDMCDSTVKGYDTPCAQERRSLSTLRLARCTTLWNSFNDSTRQWHKDTIIVHWNDVQQKTTIVKERML